MNCLDRRNDADAQLFVDHKAEDAHHGSTTVVELNRTLAQFGGGIKSVPAEVNVAIAEVARELSARDVLHETKLQESNEDDDLGNSSGADGGERGNTVGDISESLSREVDVTRQTDSSFLNEVSKNSKHGNTAVLELDVSEAIEFLFVAITDETQRIVKAERGLGSKLLLKRHVGGDRGADRVLRRGESGSRGNKGGGDSELHGRFRLERVVRRSNRVLTVAELAPSSRPPTSPA